LYCELGGEWVGREHNRVIDLCRKFGLDLIPHRFDSSFAERGKISGTLPAGKWPFDPKLQAKLKKKAKAILNKGPNGEKDQEKFDKQYDEYYLDKMSRAKLEFYYPADGETYFLVSQQAPSLYGKRHATGGKFKLNDKGELVEYEEIFRTWKMMPDTLLRRGGMLFERMVKGESLEPYWTKNSHGEEYVEFPEPNVYYDKVERKWKTKA